MKDLEFLKLMACFPYSFLHHSFLWFHSSSVEPCLFSFPFSFSSFFFAFLVKLLQVFVGCFIAQFWRNFLMRKSRLPEKCAGRWPWPAFEIPWLSQTAGRWWWLCEWGNQSCQAHPGVWGISALRWAVATPEARLTGLLVFQLPPYALP